MKITQSTRVVYRAPTKGRDYFSAKSAAWAEARAQMGEKYPQENPAYENGMCYDPGWHWSNEERLVLTHARLARRILNAFRSARDESKKVTDAR